MVLSSPVSKVLFSGSEHVDRNLTPGLSRISHCGLTKSTTWFSPELKCGAQYLHYLVLSGDKHRVFVKSRYYLKVLEDK